MEENPYSAIVGMMKKQSKIKDNILIGEVVASSPLRIKIGDLQIDKDNILVADYLLSGYSRDYNTDRLIPNGSSQGVVRYTNGMSIGDKLAILQTGDSQLYIVIARVKEV